MLREAKFLYDLARELPEKGYPGNGETVIILRELAASLDENSCLLEEDLEELLKPGHCGYSRGLEMQRLAEKYGVTFEEIEKQMIRYDLLDGWFKSSGGS